MSHPFGRAKCLSIIWKYYVWQTTRTTLLWLRGYVEAHHSFQGNVNSFQLPLFSLGVWMVGGSVCTRVLWADKHLLWFQFDSLELKCICIFLIFTFIFDVQTGFYIKNVPGFIHINRFKILALISCLELRNHTIIGTIG